MKIKKTHKLKIECVITAENDILLKHIGEPSDDVFLLFVNRNIVKSFNIDTPEIQKCMLNFESYNLYTMDFESVISGKYSKSKKKYLK